MLPSEVLEVRTPTYKFCGGTQFNLEQRHTLNSHLAFCLMAFSELKPWKLLGSEGEAVDTLGAILKQSGMGPVKKCTTLLPFGWIILAGRYSIFSQKSWQDWVPVATTATLLTHPDVGFLPSHWSFPLLQLLGIPLKQITNTLLRWSLCLRLCFWDYPNSCFCYLQ